MKTILNNIGNAIDIMAGAAGGLAFSILTCLTLSTALRIADIHVNGLWAIILGLLLIGPIIGFRRRDYFAQFMGPIFNATALDGGSHHLGPDNVESVKDLLMQVLYGIAVILLLIATVFSARTPLIISTTILIAYSIYAMRIAKHLKKAQPSPPS